MSGQSSMDATIMMLLFVARPAPPPPPGKAQASSPTHKSDVHEHDDEPGAPCGERPLPLFTPPASTRRLHARATHLAWLCCRQQGCRAQSRTRAGCRRPPVAKRAHSIERGEEQGHHLGEEELLEGSVYRPP